MPFTQLIYYSRNRSAPKSGQPMLAVLRSILSASRRNNERDGITGFLICDGPWFIQILEGEPEPVARAYERIRGDTRHGDVSLSSMRAIKRRGFPRWSMAAALRTLDHREIFLRHGISDAIDPTRLSASTILALANDLQGLSTAPATEPPDVVATDAAG